MRVAAHYDDGTIRDVTAWAKFQSNDKAVVSVTGEGLVVVESAGQAPIMVRFDGHAASTMFTVPYAKSVKLTGWKENNFIDRYAGLKFRELGIEPSPLCDDATFLRRAYLDAIGRLPTISETRSFLESKEAGKREQLVDRLLGLSGGSTENLYNDQYAAYWTLKWSDLLRNSSFNFVRNVASHPAMWSFHNWIKESFRTNKPYDQFAREIITATGSTFHNGAVNYFILNRSIEDKTESTAQVFLGSRLECAKCHHHPFQAIRLEDYYGFASCFAQLAMKRSQHFGMRGQEEVLLVFRWRAFQYPPRSGNIFKPTTLDGTVLDHPTDRRIALADWMVSGNNKSFARTVVNRYVGYLLGRGLVEPVDDLRTTNPPSNAALLDALADDFIAHRYDLKHLLRTIMVSRLYQLDSKPTPQNVFDQRFYSHYFVKRMAAEPLLDAIDDVTGVRTKFEIRYRGALPPGTRAVELPDSHYPNHFLTTFAKPKRLSVCECERPKDESLSQALHMLNGEFLAAKIADKQSRVAKLLAAGKTNDEILSELYLAALSREPTTAERTHAAKFLQLIPDRQECFEDLLWVLLNSKQFKFVR